MNKRIVINWPGKLIITIGSCPAVGKTFRYHGPKNSSPTLVLRRAN